MTLRSSTTKFFGIIALIAFAITGALMALPRAASAAEVPSKYETIASAAELAAFFNADAPAENPNAELTAEGVVTLLAPVTITGEYGVYLDLSDNAPITLDLGGQTLTFENGSAEYNTQLICSNPGELTLTGEGSLTFAIPPDPNLVGLIVAGSTVNIACDVTMQRPESSTATMPYVYIESGAVNIARGGTLRQVATDSGETYTGSYYFIWGGYDDNPATSALTVDGGTLEVAENHWGAAANDHSTITVTSGMVRHSATKFVGDEYPDALLAVRSGTVAVNGGLLGPQTGIGAKAGATATMAGGMLFGMLYGEGEDTMVTLSDGVVTGYDYNDAEAGVQALSVGDGAQATLTNGLLTGDIYASGAASHVTISGGIVNGHLYESDGASISVAPNPENGNSAAFYYPVPLAMLEGFAASGTVSTNEGDAVINYYGSLEAAREDVEAAYRANTYVLTGMSATASPAAVIGFAGFGPSAFGVNDMVGEFKSWLGDDIPEATGAQLFAYAIVTPGQTYTFTFTDASGAVLGEKTLTAGPDQTGLFCAVDVHAPAAMQPASGASDTGAPTGSAGSVTADVPMSATRVLDTLGTDVSANTNDTNLPTVSAGTYTVTVKPAAGQAAACAFAVNEVTHDFNGGYEEIRGEAYGALTALYPGARFSLSGMDEGVQRPGYRVSGWTTTPDGLLETPEDGSGPYVLNPLFAGEAITVTAQWEPDVVGVSRLWNPYNGAHLLTTDANEVATLEGVGWKDEGTVFSEYGSAYPESTPVMRVYNPFNGDHLYSTSRTEVASLVQLGWKDEGVKFYGSPDKTHPVYRLWNSLQTADGGLGSHLWTADHNEYVTLPNLPPVGAWQQENAVWYAISVPTN